MILQVLNHFSNDAVTSCGQNPVDQIRRIKLCEYQIFAISIDLRGFCPSTVFHSKNFNEIPTSSRKKRTLKKKSTRKKQMSVISPPMFFCRRVCLKTDFSAEAPHHIHILSLFAASVLVTKHWRSFT